MLGYGGYGLFGGLGMGLGMIVWVVLIALVIWALVRLPSGRTVQQSEGPLDILKQRYARGEISKAEFEQAKQDLA